MGIGSAFFREILRTSQWHKCDGRALMLGRQRLNMWKTRPKHPAFEGKPVFQKAARSIGSSLDVNEIQQKDKYSETFFDKIGFGPMETLDLSDYQGANIIHDLNREIPEELREQFSVIIDGGTIEHIFNLPMAWANVFNMLAPGGVVIASNPMNGMPGHGMFQLSPEAIYTFWKRTAGCEVIDCRALTRGHPSYVNIPIPDPDESQSRATFPRWARMFEVNIVYVVRKSADSQLSPIVSQSDYIHKWKRADRD